MAAYLKRLLKAVGCLWGPTVVCSLRGPHGPQKQSSVVKKVGKPWGHCGIPITTEHTPEKVFRGPHGPRISG